MNTIEMAEAVQKHAVQNYEVSGWDYIVECWDRKEIQEELERQGIITLEEAIREFGYIAHIWDDRRKDVEAERF